jgi:hypothetical protein
MAVVHTATKPNSRSKDSTSGELATDRELHGKASIAVLRPNADYSRFLDSWQKSKLHELQCLWHMNHRTPIPVLSCPAACHDTLIPLATKTHLSRKSGGLWGNEMVTSKEPESSWWQ